MKITFIAPVFAMILFSLIGCKSFDVLPPDYEGASISFGQGGGFVGRETAHVLLDNGEIFSMDYQMNFEPAKRLNPSVTQQLFSNVETLGLHGVNYMRPGNTYKFIEIKSPAGVNRISWDDMSQDVPKTFLTYFNVLKSHVE